MQPIHDHMPVIIARSDYAEWLDPQNEDVGSLMRLVRPYPAQRMAGRTVSTRVNQPENDDDALIQEARPRQSSLL